MGGQSSVVGRWMSRQDTKDAMTRREKGEGRREKGGRNGFFAALRLRSA
jgi:hypothetical protein